MENPTTTSARHRPIDVSVDLLVVDDIVRVPGERRHYRVSSTRTVTLFPTRNQEADYPADDRARVVLTLRPISRGCSASVRRFRPTDEVALYLMAGAS